MKWQPIMSLMDLCIVGLPYNRMSLDKSSSYQTYRLVTAEQIIAEEQQREEFVYGLLEELYPGQSIEEQWSSFIDFCIEWMNLNQEEKEIWESIYKNKESIETVSERLERRMEWVVERYKELFETLDTNIRIWWHICG